ncbi:probable carboxylesterase 1 [Coffea eugenioides]|uniref:probable carboxylesterase 1 n=1 Tax=Coffea eugenioides TaxID=49369 RepID=UPI000F613FBE|nr:probable carboxylesterase 1 [Coffea eugenioides]
MDSTPSTEVLHDSYPYFRVYKDGRIEKFAEFPYTPPSEDPQTGVKSKDILIPPENNVSVRLYLPRTTTPDEKLPIIIYIHGGAFVIESAFSPLYDPYLNSLAAEAKAIAVSIEYRLAPEHPFPACYDDSWIAFEWVLAHASSAQGPEAWINNHADFARIFLAGDSAGANIAHDVMVRASEKIGPGDEVKIAGMILVHPYFGDGKPDMLDKLFSLIAPDISICDDPRLHPMAHPDLLSRLVCKRVLVLTAEKDFVRERSLLYYCALKKSRWDGELEMMETEEEGHCFHLPNPTSEPARVLMKRIVTFINQDPS